MIVDLLLGFVLSASDADFLELAQLIRFN